MFLLFVLLLLPAHSVTLSWIPSATPKIRSQWVRCGLAHGGPYTRYKKNVGAKITSTVLKVTPGIPLFCVATAVSTAGIESGASNEVSIVP